MHAASSAGTIEGQVRNAATDAYLNNARIRVQGTTLMAFTDESGRYRITGGPAGPVTLEVFSTGLAPPSAQITVGSGQSVVHDVVLTSAERYGAGMGVVQLDPFKVAATRETDIESIATQRAARSNAVPPNSSTINRSEFNIKPGEMTDKVAETISLSLSIAGATPRDPGV